MHTTKTILLGIELFITKKLFRSKAKSAFSKNAINIAVLSVALGIAVMVIAVSIVTGFKKEIAEKVIGFNAHIHITHFDTGLSFETRPVDRNERFYKKIREDNRISHIQVFASKAGIIRTDEHIQGVMVKGVGSDFKWDFFEDRLQQGRVFEVTDTARINDIIISASVARLLNLNLEDRIQVWFIQDPPRVRVFDIVGIYETGLEEFDNLYVLADIGHIQRLNAWEAHQVQGFEVFVKDFNRLREIDDFIYDEIGFNHQSKTIKEIYPGIFDWLSLLDMNAIVILVIMLLVAAINMITTLLIIILDRTNMIGILKTLGTANRSIRKVFLYYAVFILSKGLIWGNIISIALCLIQIHFGVITLPQETYFVSVVPVNLNIWHIALINLGTIICTLLMLIGPSYITTRITPVKAIKLD